MKVKNHLISVFVILIVAFIIIPLPPFLLDFMFIFNISLSLIILLITMYIREALQFSIFPSMLLITTLFRLGLNISSTRLILTQEGNAGQVIATFGNFVLGGNVVVGFVVFLIIVIVQFIVITKGAERVAEVSARFTLDAMPGKQMAIDADLSSGLISEDMARQRRYNIQKEAEFYGAMDGATKFVKGDAIMAIVITFINFLGGILIGLVQSDHTFSEVLSIYTIASVGDGMVCQVPALLISTATGMIVTRAASDSSLGADVTKQFSAQPTVLMIAGAAMAFLMFIPGMPKPQMIILSIAMIALGATLRRKMGEQASQEEAAASEEAAESPYQDETDYFRDIDNVYELLPIDVIEMNFGYSVIPLVDQGCGSNFVERLVMFRKQFALDMGMVIPAVRLRDDAGLNPNHYVIKLRGEEVTRGEILVDYYLALDPGNLTGEIDGIDTIEPAYGIPSKWITPDKRDLAEIYGYTVIDPLSVIVTHLSETIRKHAHEILSRQDVNQLIETLKKNGSSTVEDVIPNMISFSNFQKVLANLLREGVPIRDMELIMETIASHVASARDIEVLTEYIRQSLKRTITRKWSEGGQIRVIVLDAEVEKVIINALKTNEQGTNFNLAPDLMQQIMMNLMDQIKKVKDAVSIPIVLTSPVVRIYFSKMVEQFSQNAVVLSYNELDAGVQIQAIGTVALDA
ncbi:MAG TPA: flagellar biosynthesis protein FlhA [Clostridiales bacterium]|nr:flagellar biosynthesis protein FlhA [Clostridiales bacterium]